MIQDIFYNEIWETPIIPVIPYQVGGLEKTKINLSNREELTWQFLFEEINEIPSAYSEKQDFNFEHIEEEKWHSVVVPGSLIMQGYDIVNNKEYYYRKTICIPKEYDGKQVFLRFEGVYSNARIWINNQYITSHVGGFTAWDCDITRFTKEEKITLIVGVTDVDGSEKGIWNPDGKRVCDCSWASSYAHNNICGILRDVTLFALPKECIVRTYINTILDDTFSNALLTIDLGLYNISKNSSIKLELFDQNQKYILEKSFLVEEKQLEIDRSKEQGKVFLVNKKIECEVENPQLWTAEHPYLYLLKISLWDHDILLQENLHNIGFRQIYYGGMANTDKNKIYVNGNEIKLRGVCRHDISYQYGRSITKEEIRQEIFAYKKNNINHVRTSHYPVSEYYLSMCDKMGIYVEHENSVCFQGANSNGVYCGTENFVNSFVEMVEYSRNHPSVIIWSLGNESGFEETDAFRIEYNYVKKVDCSRPVIFSYPDTVQSDPLPYDIYSKHYNEVTGELGGKDMPVLHDEFAHVCCYNTKELSQDQNYRNVWGESILKGWENILKTDGALGCAIWGGIDDIFYLPDGTSKSHQSHSESRVAGYGEWGCILDVFKREKPEAYLTKKAFSPIRVRMEKSSFNQDMVLYVDNWFDHTCTSEIRVVCIENENTILYDQNINETIQPHQSGFIILKNIQTNANYVTIRFYHGEIEIDEYVVQRTGVEDSILEKEHKMETSCFLEVQNNDRTISLNGKLLRLEVKRDSGEIHIFYENNYIAEGPQFFVKDIELEDHMVDQILIEETKKEIILIIEERYLNGLKIKKTMKFDGIQLNTILEVMDTNKVFTGAEHFGIYYNIKREIDFVEWNRKGLYSNYPKNHIGRTKGRAYSKRKNYLVEKDKYGTMPAWGWELDMANYFLFSEEDKNQYLVTNDFKTTRNNIIDYIVKTNSCEVISIKALSEDISAFIDYEYITSEEMDIRLQLTLGNYYKSLGWGNYLGEQMKLENYYKLHYNMMITK